MKTVAAPAQRSVAPRDKERNGSQGQPDSVTPKGGITSYKTWFDGKIMGPGEALISPLSHALHYGTSTFEGLRAYETGEGPAVFRLQDHLKRLFFSAAFLDLQVRFTQKDLEKAVLDVIRANDLGACYIRPLLFYGTHNLGFALNEIPTHAFVAAYPMGTFLGEQGRNEGVRIKTVSWRKTPSASVPASAKLGGNYVNPMLAFLEAKKAGFQEAMILRQDGSVAEGAGDNIFCVQDGELLTPTSSDDNLPGITRDSVIRIAKSLKIPFREATLSRGSVVGSDEVFLTGTAVEVTPVRDIDGRPVGTGKPGPITKRIQDAYFKAVRGELPGFENWTTHVRR